MITAEFWRSWRICGVVDESDAAGVAPEEDHRRDGEGRSPEGRVAAGLRHEGQG